MTPVVFLATAILLLHTVRTQHYQRSKRSTIREKSRCRDGRVYGPSGTISSPGYPTHYSNHISCTWYIIPNKTENIIISFNDLDIEEDSTCVTPPCCNDNWIKIGPSPDKEERKYCGQHRPPSFISVLHPVWVKFYISNTARGGKGFNLSYVTGPETAKHCKQNEFHCLNYRCIPRRWHCNRRDECGDGSDEMFCEGCSSDEMKCGNSNECYKYASQQCNRIWDCSNGADEIGCGDCSHGFLACHSGIQCYPPWKQCDGFADCSDLSDEFDCSYCGPNRTRCGAHSSECFDFYKQRCNRVLDCKNGEDERGCLDCGDKIPCLSGQGCYSLSERCNGVAQCEDYSDEKDCGSNLCKSEHGGFLCGNGHCIREIWKCDRTNDCGDGTDEENCLKNSVISAAVMGSLICGLLLVIAISCTCRLYSLRFVEQQVSNRETPLSRLTQEFLYREPPPSYAMAVGQQGQSLCVESLHYEVEGRHHHRRSRRFRQIRRTSCIRPSSPSNTSQGTTIVTAADTTQTGSVQSCDSSTFPDSSQNDNSLATAISFISNSDSDIDLNSPHQRKDEKLDGLSPPVLMEYENMKTSDIQNAAENELPNVTNELSNLPQTRVQCSGDINLNILSVHSCESLHTENTVIEHDTEPLITE